MIVGWTVGLVEGWLDLFGMVVGWTVALVEGWLDEGSSDTYDGSSDL